MHLSAPHGARALLFTSLVLTRPRTAAASLLVRPSSCAAAVSARSRLARGCRMMTTTSPAAPTTAEAFRRLNARIDGAAPELRLLNSLTQQVEPFVPMEPQQIKWYICGPTVYDAAHVGHARNYVAFDVMRRILTDYFGFDILYVMNITDIDDKIILRTHLNHLVAMVDAVHAHKAASDAALPDVLKCALKVAEDTLALPKPGLPELLAAQRDLAAAAVESGASGVTACDVQAAFTQLTARYEADFFDDMASLNVLPPSAITRVSDYVPEIISYIEKIGENGFCYEANGSVYFDTVAFNSDETKRYGKLDPSKVAAGQAAGNAGASDAAAAAVDTEWTEGKSVAELLAEGEGSLSSGSEGDKRHPADFVLWKASKVGEPAWDSPWGMGRPGWHIECSAMASDLLGQQMDINAGGCDLKFPHHENQIAQAEAHYNKNCCAGEQWVNYFLHSGHLQIEGLKMSKSLKNFITIKGALEAYSPNQIRFLFLLRRFSEPMEYSENTLAAAADLERRFAAFGAGLASRLKEADAATAAAADAAEDSAAVAALGLPPLPAQPPVHKWGEAERTLQAAFAEKRREVHACLCDSIDTPGALKALEQLVRATNSYMGQVSDVSQGGTLLTMIQRYFAKVMTSFGVPGIAGTSSDGGQAGSAGGVASTEQVATALSEFRDRVRSAAIASVKSGGGSELGPEVLRVCDELRDETLPPLGIQLDDRSSGVAQVQIADPKVVMAEAARKAEAAEKAAAEKAAKAAKREAEAAMVAARALVPPLEMFKPEHDELFERSESYGELDAEGLPVSDAAGEALSKSAKKKLKKVMDKHAKAFEAAK